MAYLVCMVIQRGKHLYDNSFFASLWLNDFLAKDSQSILLNFSTNIVKNTILGLFYRGTWNQRSIENIVGITASYNWTKILPLEPS